MGLLGEQHPGGGQLQTRQDLLPEFAQVCLGWRGCRDRRRWGFAVTWLPVRCSTGRPRVCAGSCGCGRGCWSHRWLPRGGWWLDWARPRQPQRTRGRRHGLGLSDPARPGGLGMGQGLRQQPQQQHLQPEAGLHAVAQLLLAALELCLPLQQARLADRPSHPRKFWPQRRRHAGEFQPIRRHARQQ